MGKRREREDATVHMRGAGKKRESDQSSRLWHVPTARGSRIMMKKIGRSKGYRTVSCKGEGTVNIRMRVAIAIIVYVIPTRAGSSRVPRSQPPPGLPRDLT